MNGALVAPASGPSHYDCQYTTDIFDVIAFVSAVTNFDQVIREAKHEKNVVSCMLVTVACRRAFEWSLHISNA